jgi:hypothetical protein
MSASWLIKVLAICLTIGLVIGQASEKRTLKLRKNLPVREKKVEVTESSAINGETDECPEPTGFFADAEQCDKYYACVDGAITEKLCPDGMVFNDYSFDQEKCDLPYNIDCSSRPKLQEPKPTLNCPRLNGYFGDADKKVCDKFFYCVDGQSNMITCPGGLVFNPKTGICTWPDEAQKKGCSSADVFDFSCPNVTEAEGQTHPRYADPDDCQFFYVCINGVVPRRNGCKLGQAFDDVNKRCNWARRIPECADWYKDRLTDAELDELENPKPKPTRAPHSPSRRKPSKKPKQVAPEAGAEK